MNLRELLEEFKDSFDYYGKYIEIFVNPTPKEIRSVLDSIHGITQSSGNGFRFIATSGKKLYVFSPELNHYSAKESLNIGKERKYYMGGTTSIKNDKYVIEEIHNFDLVGREAVKKWAKDNWKNWSWLEKYRIVV